LRYKRCSSTPSAAAILPDLDIERHGQQVAENSPHVVPSDARNSCSDQVWRLLADNSDNSFAVRHICRSIGRSQTQVRDTLRQLEVRGIVAKVASEPLMYRATPDGVRWGIERDLVRLRGASTVDDLLS
jgi:Sugar-specific transcriptional regulator TrmB